MLCGGVGGLARRRVIRAAYFAQGRDGGLTSPFPLFFGSLDGSPFESRCPARDVIRAVSSSRPVLLLPCRRAEDSTAAHTDEACSDYEFTVVSSAPSLYLRAVRCAALLSQDFGATCFSLVYEPV
ncbi:hypothetical protein HPB50_013988 [Hyalomma asiaticum]|uniref:Uncharacterized protein n=1 Tax=Hyalomma asiaticum TaxID=266040 RepID=A0ACB7S5L8_HYAAI|nr:hypothetical protein HPB50_013988 [Hyalomma asiaticum]